MLLVLKPGTMLQDTARCSPGADIPHLVIKPLICRSSLAHVLAPKCYECLESVKDFPLFECLALECLALEYLRDFG